MPAKDVLVPVAICSLYSLLSTGCILHNKYLLSSVVPHEDVLVVFQNVFAICFILVVGKYHDGGATTETGGKAEPFSIRRALVPRYTLYHSTGDWAVGMCYSLSVITGMWCLFHLTVPTFSAVKKSGMIFSWLIEAANPTPTTWACLPSLFVVMTGTILQTWYDLEFSALGVFFGALSCVFQSASFEIGKRMMTHGKDLWSVLLINSVVSLLLQLVYMSIYGEAHLLGDVVKAVFFADSDALVWVTNRKSEFLTASVDTLHARATGFQVGMHVLANCTLIMLMNFSIFLNCTVNSPLAHVVTGNVKSIITTISGILIFSLQLHSMGYAGIVVGFLGGAWFSIVKYREQTKPKRSQDVAADKELIHVSAADATSPIPGTKPLPSYS